MQKSPTSPIELYRYIALIKVKSSHAQGWSPASVPAGSQRLLRQAVRVEAQVSTVLKPSDLKIPADIKFQVQQTKPADGFLADDYGPWSNLDPVPGLELLVFANESRRGTGIEMALEDACGLIVNVQSPQVPFAVDDVRRALAWERAVGRRLLDSDQVRKQIIDDRSNIGPLLASYLVDSIPERDLSKQSVAQAHRFLVTLVSMPEINVRFRRVILANEINELNMAEFPPSWFRSQLIAAMLSVLADNKANILHDPIQQSYLANSVFDAHSKPFISARDVFPLDADRIAAASLLQRRKFDIERLALLIEWLR